MSDIITGNGPVIRIADPERTVLQSIPDTDRTVAEVGPTGMPALEPLVAVTRGDQTAFHLRCSPDRAAAVLSSVGETDDSTTATPDVIVDHEPNATRFPMARLTGEDTGVREVFGACGWHRPTDPADHEEAGGFADPDPGAVLDLGKTLYGRGWGDLCHDEPLAETWSAVRGADGEKTVVVNAHGTAADTLLLASAPFEPLDGAVAVARTVDADRIVVYASIDDDRAVETVREAIESYPDRQLDMDVVTGPAAYRAAEPTMTIEAIEGNHRLEARVRPPGPDEVGLYGQPTLVHTPRTVAQLAVALREGDVRDTRAITVTGDVENSATVEVPESQTLDTVLNAVDMTGEFKAAHVGGQFGAITDDLDVRVSPDAMTATDFGTEGTVHVLTADRCLVEFVGRRTQFAADENCGRCVPCREGTSQLTDLLRDIYSGEYDPDGIAELTEVMATSSLCAFGVQAGRPARTALEAFESEFSAHAAGQCPAGSCLEPLET